MNPDWDKVCDGVPVDGDMVDDVFGVFWAKDHDEDRTWFIQRILKVSL